MKNIGEINHCRPNSKAFWCSRCKAHNPYNYSISTEGSERYGCKACGFSMFKPSQTQPWMHGFIICTAILILMGVFFIIYPVGPENLELVCLGFAAYTGLLGGVMIYYQRKWMTWSVAKRLKTVEALEFEAINHSFQPKYEKNEYFTDWARQFLSEQEVDRLHEKYGQDI